MADTKTPEERSKNMAAIKSKNTTPEIYLRHLLFAKGYRYSLHSSSVPGHPDLWMKKYNTAVFVHGCFWYRHPNCKYSYMPKSRSEYWSRKFDKNVAHDEAIKKQLVDKNIRCLVVWECTIRKAQKKDGKPEQLLASIEEFLRKDCLYKEI